ncbi:MAG: hypothetical protein IKM97_02535 [Clostridia bacterium]|nr:hypothetical protein [Clostridia bacterium]
MIKKIVFLGIICITLLSMFLLWWMQDDRELELEKIGLGSSFKYDSKEIIKDMYAFTGKKTILYRYYYSDEQEELLIKEINNYGHWKKIEDMDNTKFYFSRGIEPVSTGYIFFKNYDYHNKVYDQYDYYNNLKLGGTITQYYFIGVIDTDNNIIWYYETERLIDYFRKCVTFINRY